MGEIGEAMARRARGFGMDVLYASRTRKPGIEDRLACRWSTLDALLGQADFVSLHTPLNAETRHLLGPAQFRLMKPSAMLINTSRGAVVDQDALVAALRSGNLAGAALDVTDPEPLPLDHPLFALPNVIITPHISGFSSAYDERAVELFAENLNRYLTNLPLYNRISSENGY